MKEIVAEHSRQCRLASHAAAARQRDYPARSGLAVPAAAPTFAFMAAFTGIPGGGATRRCARPDTYLGTEWDGSNVLADERSSILRPGGSSFLEVNRRPAPPSNF